MSNVWALAIAFVSSGAFAALINVLFSAWKTKQDRKNGVAAGVRIILDDRIAWLGEKYVEAGEISAENLRTLIAMQEVYHSLDGNGYHDALMDKVMKLPIRR